MSLSTASLQSSMLALFVLLAPAFVADQLADTLADVSNAQAQISTETASAELPSFVLPEIVVTADRVAPISLPEVVVTAERLAPLSLPDVVVVAERLAPDARLAQADTVPTVRQFEVAANVAPLATGLGANETIQP